MPDDHTTLGQMRKWVARFVEERDWRQFHAPKNLSMSLAIEAAELMEHFQWIDVEASRAVRHAPDKLSPICDEMADVLCYLLALANELDVDLSEAVEKKLSKNAAKYPVEQCRGRYQRPQEQDSIQNS